MDGLLAEINAKRKALADIEGESSGGPKKYLRKADLERAQEEAEKKTNTVAEEKRNELRAAKLKRDAEKARQASLARLAQSPTPGGTPGGSGTPEPNSNTDGNSTPQPVEAFNISPEECIRRLRQKGQPIRLFGETDKDRRLRLRALELLQERGGSSGGAGQNDWKRALEEMESSMEAREVERKARAAHILHEGKGGKEGTGEIPKGGEGDGGKKKVTDTGILDLGLIKTDPNKLYPLIYYALKNVLKEWEEWLDNRPDDIKRSTQGKLAAATQVQSGQNMKPLFKSLRSRELAPDVVRHLAELVHHMQSRSYQRANDAYLRLSIGNAAWPIGVTSVGIHERSAREKIGADNIAHVLNDEVSRKYIQAVKRLLTFAQTVRPPDDISQLMG